MNLSPQKLIKLTEIKQNKRVHISFFKTKNNLGNYIRNSKRKVEKFRNRVFINYTVKTVIICTSEKP